MALNNTPTKYIWFNGKMVNYADAKVHVLSHALHYGTAVFEGIRAYNTPKGPCVFRLNEHIDRLFNSARIYRFPVPFTKDEVKDACCKIISENGLASGYIRPLIFMGEIGLGVHIPEGSKAEVMVAAMPWGAYLGKDGLEKGVPVCVSSWNRLAPNTIPTEAKAAGNYLSSILISNEAARNGYAEAIALDTDGFISEGSGENVFFVKDGAIYTAPFTNGLLPGITRHAIITLAKEVLHIPVYEQKMQREMCYLADEAFFTGTAAEITPISSIDGLDVGPGKRGPITKQLQETFFDLVQGKIEDKWGWLTPVNK